MPFHVDTIASMEISKKTVAGQLKEAARLLDVLGEDAFRAKAYQSAARNLEAFEGDLNDLFERGRLNEIRGIGQGLAQELYALESQEQLPILDELYEKVPEGVRSLFTVSGLGAKKVGLLWQNGIDSLDALAEAAADGRIAAMKGFGKKSAQNILEGAQFALEAQKRMRLDAAELFEHIVLEALEPHFPKAQFQVVGSLRRGLETVGDLNLLATGVRAQDAAEALEPVATLNSVTDTHLYAHVDVRDLHINFIPKEAIGAALLMQTGNADYRASLVAQAQEKGFELKDDGLYKHDKRINTPEESDVLLRLELPFIVPERRETAHPEPVPGLIKLEDVRGLVHNHSTWSDAAHSIREMVGAAVERDYAYLAMADHSRTSYYANGLSIERVHAQAEEVATIRTELQAQGNDFGLLHGLEVDILPDGSLDYPDEVLKSLDYTVVSVHQNFTLSEKDQTKRIIRAVQNPYASILGHVTGRLLLRRPSYAVDQLAVIEACAEAGTVIEINASPYRLDMDWRMVIRAKELGCKFSVNPDAHHMNGFDDVYYGVLMARKAGLTPQDVVNTAPTAQSFLMRLKN